MKLIKTLGWAAAFAAAAWSLPSRAETYYIGNADDLTAVFQAAYREAIQRRTAARSGRRTLLGAVEELSKNAVFTNDVQLKWGAAWPGLPDDMDLVIDLNGYTLAGADGDIKNPYGCPALWVTTSVTTGDAYSGAGGRITIKDSRGGGIVRGGNGYWVDERGDNEYPQDGSSAIRVDGTNATFVISGNLTVIGGTGADYTGTDTEEIAGYGGSAVYAEGGKVSIHLKDGATLSGGKGGVAENAEAGYGGNGVGAYFSSAVSIAMDEGTTIVGGAAGDGDEEGAGYLRDWYDDENGTVKTSTIEFQTFTYTFDANGGTPTKSVAKEYWTDVTDDVTAATNSAPTRPGYTFTGWQFNGAAVDFADYKKPMMSSNLTFKATWTPVTYTVAYVLDDGANDGANPTSYTIEDATITLKDATKTGYTFKGWTTGGVGGTAITAIATGSTGDLTLYANWEINQYTVTFKDGELVLDEQTLDYNAPITYRGKNPPVKASDAASSYTFSKWTPDFEDGVSTVAVGGNTYTAVWATTPRTYTITWNVEGKITTGSYAYGETPAYTGTSPSRASANGITWNWNSADGWEPAIATVTGDATYTAKFTPVPLNANYKVFVWYDWDDTVLKTVSVLKTDGDPAFGGIPTRASDAQYDYVFKEWTTKTDTDSVTEYKAVYSQTLRHYTVTWDVDGALTAQDAEYGAVPSEPAALDKTKAGYEFAGWVPTLEEVPTVTNDVTFVAQFTAAADPSGNPPTNYVVTFYDEDGKTVLKSEALAAGGAIVPPSDPVKVATEEFAYTFAGWTKEGAVVDLTDATATADATYTATYAADTRTYTVTWVVGDRVETETYAYGWTPSYTGNTSKAEDADYIYTFTGWSPEIAVVTGDATYEAQYTATANTSTPGNENKIAITWVDEDGVTVLKTELVEKDGSGNVWPNNLVWTPQKAATEAVSYTFMGWTPAISATTTIKEDTVYRAGYAATPRSYDVTWVTGDDATVTTTEYGKMPVFIGDTAKAATADFTYEFTGWTPDVVPVTGEATYEAVYKALAKDGDKWAVTWLNDDGSLIREETVAKGAALVPPADPVKAATAAESYAFAGWTPEVPATATDNLVFKATYAKTARQYAITWVVGAARTVSEAAYGTTPAYPGATPTEADKVFAGWTPQVASVTGEATYTAQFEAKGDPTGTPPTYAVTFKDDDGRVIASAAYESGATPTVPADPAKAATDEFDYTFAGWTPEVAAVAGEATYTATYAATRRTYTVTWDVDGATTVTTVEYGATPAYPGTTPTRAADTAQGIKYAFAGWTPEVAAVTNDATYEAVFTGESTKSGYYAITWLDDDGAELGVTSVAANATPTFPDPAKAATDEFEYAFAGWTPTVAAATANATYRATYARTRRVYTVTWDVEGTKTTTQAEYGATPEYAGATPAKAATDDFTYTFAGWYPTVEAVTGEATYTARFTAESTHTGETPAKFAITWQNDDGTPLLTELVEDGATPAYTGATPVKAGTDGTTYAFAGWTPDVAAATKDATYTATYTASPVTHTITWVVEGQASATQVAHGALPVYAGEKPTKTGYVFDGWAPTVVAAEADATYTAQFTAEADPSGDPATYAVTFKDDDGRVISSAVYESGQMPTVPADPAKAATDEFDYAFAGWTPEVAAVAGDATYTATYAATRRTYTVTWDVDGVKTVDRVEYGKTPFFVGAEPTKSGYTFIGWNPDVAAVTGDALYTAKFAAGEKPDPATQVLVVWEDGDGNVLANETVAKGDTPSAYSGPAPTKEATAEWVYTWDGGWTPAVGPVTSDTTYTATFTAAKRTYAVTWIVEGKTYADTADYGAVPVFDEAAFGVTLATAKAGYDFSNWAPIPEATTNDATYTAQFTAKTEPDANPPKTYVVTFYDDDGRVIQTKAYTEAEVENFTDYPADPVKAATEAESYTFAGWAETVVTDDENHIDFVATYAAVARTYAVTWVVEGVSTNVETYAYGAMPAYPDATPVKTGYRFKNWAPTLAAVTGDITYTAQFEAYQSGKFTITFVDEDGTILQTGAYAKDAAVTEPAEKPAKAEDAEYTYAFAQWTPAFVNTAVADATYTATYAATRRTYAVTWQVEGLADETEQVAYGTTPTHADPTRDGYAFTGWSPAPVAVTEAATYVAQFKAKEEAGKVTVTFYDEDGTTILLSKAYDADVLIENVEKPADPDPSARDTAQYTYAFGGWTPALPDNGTALTEAGSPYVYKATYTVATKRYTVTWRVDGTETTQDYDYGATPVYNNGTDPKKSGYTFEGWNPALAPVTEAVTYKAQFVAEATPDKPYVISFYGEDGDLIQTGSYADGETVTAPAAPEKASSEAYSYEFLAWSPAFSATARGSVDYTATYATVPRVYTLTFDPDNGEEVKTASGHFGDGYTQPADPEKTGRGFTGWALTDDPDKALVALPTTIPADDRSYTAQYTNYLYTVTWTVLANSTRELVEYGALPPAHAAPDGYTDDDFTYAFREWSPATNAAIMADTTYTAQFDAKANETKKGEGYVAVTWVNGDGATIAGSPVLVAVGDEPEEPAEALRTKTADDDFTYEFTGWTPAVAPVYADTTFAAQFKAVSRKSDPPTGEDKYYAVTWQNWNGETLGFDSVKANATPSYTGETPARPGDEKVASYTFEGWTKDGAAVTLENETVTADTVYTATFKEGDKTAYTITFKDWDGTVLGTPTAVAYGEMPTAPTAPTRTATADFTYTFKGWLPAVVSVTGEATYTADYTAASAKPGYFAVKWVDWDGTELDVTSVSLGDAPVYTKENPTKEADAENTYAFAGWDPTTNGVAIAADTTFTAQYAATTKKGGYYTVTWKNADGTPLQSDAVKSGDPLPEGPVAEQAATAQHTYTFTGWDPTTNGVTAVTGNLDYTATYDAAVNQYEVTWTWHDDSKTATVDYGTLPTSAPETVPGYDEGDYTYAFRDWAPATNAAITAEATFKAQYTATLKGSDKPDSPNYGYYAVTWIGGAGETLDITKVARGDAPVYTNTTPTKADGEFETYTFTGWEPTTNTAVTADATFTAQFAATSKKGGSWAVRFVDWDGTELANTVLADGAEITAPEKPTRDGDEAVESYEFTGWTPALNNGDEAKSNVTYVATYAAAAKAYTVTWKVDGQADETVQVAYGAAPSGAPANPTKAEDDNYTYTFRDWAPSTNTVITAAATFEAQFDAKQKTGGDPTDPKDPKFGKVAVTWVDGDGATLSTETVDYGSEPVYTGKEPTKADGELVTYTFREWSPATNGVELVEDTTFTAQFDAKSRKGGSWAVTWVVDGVSVRTDIVKDGGKPDAAGVDTTKAADAQYTYAFKGWTKDGTTIVTLADEAVTANTTYTAKFEGTTVATYTVTWFAADGTTELHKDENLAYGAAVPAYTGETPTKAADDNYTYTFREWSPATNTTVTTDLEFTAQFDKTAKPTDRPEDPTFGRFTITWADGDGKTIKTDDVPMGDDPTPPDPSAVEIKKTATVDIAYVFNGTWLPELAPATTSATYTAQFDAVSRKPGSWAVRFVDWDGTELQNGLVKADETIAAPTDPSRSGDEKVETYTFAAWVNATNATEVLENTTKATKDVTYVATYTATAKQYDVTWKVDGQADETVKVAYGKAPTGAPADPTKAEDDNYTYTFRDWSPSTNTVVTAAATFEAQFDAKQKTSGDPTDPKDPKFGKVAVTWVDGDGKTLSTETVDYGSEPVYTGKEPTKADGELVTYTFREWSPATNDVELVEDTTFTAQFDAKSRKGGSWAVTWVVDGVSVRTDIVKDGGKPDATGVDTDKAADAQYAYTFAGWTPSTNEAVRANKTFEAQYTQETVATYTVKWLNYDETELLKNENLAYGAAVPAYTGETPTKAADDNYTYTFRAWSPATNTTVTANLAFTAQFDKTAKPTDKPTDPTFGRFTITWADGDGATLYTEDVPLNDTPAFDKTKNGDKEPTKTATVDIAYVFNGTWLPELAPATTSATYTAQFDAVSRKPGRWAVRFVDWDGTELQSGLVKENETIEVPADPSRKGDEKVESYAFAKWVNATNATEVLEKNTTKATKDVTYVATYTESAKQYDVTWKVGESVTTVKVSYGEAPSGAPANPTKAEDDDYTYTFRDWAPSTNTVVTAAATFEAQFDATLKHTGGDPTDPKDPKFGKVAVTWVDGDGVTLYTETVNYGAAPAYDKAKNTGDKANKEPTKADGELVTYTFREWSPATNDVELVEDTTFTAQFDAKSRKGGSWAVTWVVDGVSVRTDIVKDGGKPDATGVDTDKAADAQYTYAFAGWAKDGTSVDLATEEVKANTTYTAEYTASGNSYTITWLNEDKTKIDETTVAYGEKPTHDAATKADDGTYTYTFRGWTPEIVPVTGEATYTAQFDATLLPPTNPDDPKDPKFGRVAVTWADGDGKTLYTEDVPLGDTPAFDKAQNGDKEPTKTATVDIAYVFNGTWLPELAPATTSATYTAQFDAVSRKPGSWAVRFVDWDGTELKSGLVKENEPIAAPADPSRKGDEKVDTYTFDKWVNATNAAEVLVSTTPATKDVTYVATYTESAKEYTVTWKVDGQDDKTVQVAYGKAPTGAPASPTKAADATYTYTFRDWAPSTNTVITAAATFVAQFDATLNHSATPDPNVGYVAVEWVDGDGRTLDLKRVSRGTAPVYTGTTPTKTADAQYTYTFREWSPATNNVELVEDATFTAQFNAKAKKGGSWAVTWVVENKTVRTDTVANGAAPVWTEANPTKAEDEKGTYVFTGWTKDGTTIVTLSTEKVEANTTYTALFALASAAVYTVTWLNGDGTELRKDENLSHGAAVPAYTGTTPTKTADATYTYTFRGWSPSTNTTVTTDLTFRPQFNATLIRPTDPTDPTDPAFGKVAVTWVDGDGATLYTEAVPLGDTPAYDNAKNEGDKQGKAPTKASGDNIAYTFADAWLPELAPATTDAVYTAVFTATSLRSDSWAVCFVDWDGTELSRATVLKDAVITAPADPTRAGDDKATAYAFDKWVDVETDAAFTAGTTTATKDVTYKAVYKVQTAATYTITWKVDGKADETTQVAYGTTPTRDAASKAKANGITYTFTGWAPTPVPVTGEATYTAKFSAALDPTDPVNEGYVLVSWVDGDGATLDTEKIPLGSTTTYKGATTPTKTEEALVRFTFTGWLPDTNTAVMAATTYTAQFDAVSKTAGSVAVRFVDWDGTEITNQVVKTNATITPPANPTRAGDARVAAYDFDKWVEATTGAAFSATATADITYKATYTETLKTFTVTWAVETAAGTQTTPVTGVVYGSEPTGAPTVANYEKDGFRYTFRDWSPATNTTVTADTTFTAQFDAALDPTDSSHEGKVSVTWVDGDGANLYTEKVMKDTVPSYNNAKNTPAAKQGQDPTKAEDALWSYTFDGWSPAVAAVTADTVYTATFKSVSKVAGTWAISWKGWDGADLGTTLVANGTAWADVEPVTAPDRTGYSFKTWADAPATVTANVTVTAVYDKHGTPDDPITVPAKPGDPVPDPSDIPYAEYVKLTGDVTNLVFAATVTNLVIDLNGYGIYGTNGVAGVDGGDALTLLATEGVFVLTNSQTTVSLVKGGTGGDGTAAHKDGYNGGTGIKTAFGPDATLTIRERITVAGGDAGQPHDETGKPGEPGPGTDAPKADGLAYELTVKYNDGATADGVTTIKYGDPVTEPTAPAWYGHSLEGWYDNDAGGAKVDFAAGYTMPARDTVLEANWTNNLFAITFVDEDGTTPLLTTNVAFESTPVYLGDAPTKTEDADFTYTFREWTPEIVPVAGAATYKAQYSAKAKDKGDGKTYYAVSWVNGNGATIGDPVSVEDGKTVAYDKTTRGIPLKDADASFTYAWDETGTPWSPDITAPVTQDTTYYAQFVATPKDPDSYAVTWNNANGKTLHTYAVKSGDPVAYTNETPTLAATADYAYKFAGWTEDGTTLVDFAGVTAAKAVTYTAVYDKYGTPDHPVVFPPEEIADYTNAECVVIRLTNDVGQLTVPAGITNVVIDLNSFSITGATGTATATVGETALVIEAADGAVTILGPGRVTGGEGYRANPAGNGGTAVDASGFAGTLLVTNGAYVVGGKGGDSTGSSGAGAGGTGVKIANADNLTVTDTSWVLGGAPGKNTNGTTGDPGEGSDPKKDDPRIDDGDPEGSGTHADPYIVHTQAELDQFVSRPDVDVTDAAVYVSLVLTNDFTDTTVTVPADYANLIVSLNKHDIIAQNGVKAGANGKDAIVLKGNTNLEITGPVGYYGIFAGSGKDGDSSTPDGGRGGAGVRAPATYTGVVKLINVYVSGGNGGDGNDSSANGGTDGKGGDGGNAVVVPTKAQCDLSDNVFDAGDDDYGVYPGHAGKGYPASDPDQQGKPGEPVGPSDGGDGPDEPDPSDNSVDDIIPQQFSRNADGTWTLKAFYHTSDGSPFANADDSAYIVISPTIAGLKTAANCKKLSACGVTVDFDSNVLTIPDLPPLSNEKAMFVELRMSPLE